VPGTKTRAHIGARHQNALALGAVAADTVLALTRGRARDSLMTPEQVGLPVLRAIGSRPKLSKRLFKFARWGDPFAPQRFSDPYDIFDTMTADGPVIRSRI
jgi:hypothetical protein